MDVKVGQIRKIEGRSVCSDTYLVLGKRTHQVYYDVLYLTGGFIGETALYESYAITSARLLGMVSEDSIDFILDLYNNQK